MTRFSWNAVLLVVREEKALYRARCVQPEGTMMISRVTCSASSFKS